MCFGSSCPNCSKQSWRGCGSHVPSVLGSVPEDQWCTCEPKFTVAGKSYPPQAGQGRQPSSGGSADQQEEETPSGSAALSWFTSFLSKK
ncbi:hypothetical protein QBC40DRAFT_286926 [Triangularia verruculosa]|uniref:Uncharacterized protein n=1 Tax=Triangularia verruculosa TaxID=2587418 RepID=A0AAN7AS82_9PEZI|nr:hypothetical protein QBC40DRAFT_286926 [Triangularia verruculosa]